MVRRSKKKNTLFESLKSLITNSQTLSLIFAFSAIGVMFVLIRMKGIEQDYALNEIGKRTKIQKAQNKELKAKRARELSTNKLKVFAKKFELTEPDEKRIIIIP